MRVTAALLFATLLAGGCTIAIPEFAKSVVDSRGIHATRAIKTPLGTYFTSTSFVPGPAAQYQANGWQQVSCASGSIAGRVSHTPATDAGAAAATCRAMLGAIRYLHPDGGHDARAEYHAVIVPNGHGIEASARSLLPFTRLRVKFAFGDSPRVAHAVVGTFAHEAVHIRNELARPGHQITPEEEELAYLAGLCARLEVLGSISAEDLPGAAIQGPSEAISRSSAAGYRVRLYVSRYFDDGPVVASSQAGKRMLADCQSRLSPTP